MDCKEQYYKIDTYKKIQHQNNTIFIDRLELLSIFSI